MTQVRSLVIFSLSHSHIHWMICENAFLFSGKQKMCRITVLHTHKKIVELGIFGLLCTIEHGALCSTGWGGAETRT